MVAVYSYSVLGFMVYGFNYNFYWVLPLKKVRIFNQNWTAIVMSVVKFYVN